MIPPTAIRRGLCAAIALLFSATPGQAQVVRAPNPARPITVRHGFAVDRLARIDTMLAEAVRREEIGGLVALVLRDDAVVYERAAGWRDREQRVPMTTDAIFRIASQTKALTSAAVLMLMEEGRLALGTPASRFMPTFARTTVAQRTDTGVGIVPARRPITIKDLLTHTAGISYGTDAIVADRYRAKGLGPAAGF